MTVRMELVFLSFSSSSELSTLPPHTTTMLLVEGHSNETMERSVTIVTLCTRIYLEGGEHRDFPILKLISHPLPRISKVYVENGTKVLVHV